MNMKLYDDRTARFDSPYQTGNCGGDGTCGTCVVQVLAGSNLLNPRVRVEDGALSKQLAPPNYRWACKVRVAPDPTMSGTLKIKLRPQSASW
jgi:ferredoxin